jgi:hypothetical protein
MNLLKKTFFIANVLVFAQLAHAQETIPASGGEATESRGSASDTVGQVFYTTFPNFN